MFDIFRDNKVSVDVVATSEISISLTLDPRRAAPAPPRGRLGWGRVFTAGRLPRRTVGLWQAASCADRGGAALAAGRAAPAQPCLMPAQ